MRRFLLLIGLSGGGFLWAANTQLGEMLSNQQCHSPIAVLALCSLVVGSITLGLAWQSLRSSKPGGAEVDVFLSRIGIMAGLLFAFAIALQGAASLVLSGCER